MPEHSATIRDLVQLEMQCPTCITSRADNPTECGHCFCDSCVEYLIGLAGDKKTKPVCPICSSAFEVLPKDKKDEYRNTLVCIAKKLDGDEPCSQCNNEQAMLFCEDGCRFLCESCVEEHTNEHTTKAKYEVEPADLVGSKQCLLHSKSTSHVCMDCWPFTEKCTECLEVDKKVNPTHKQHPRERCGPLESVSDKLFSLFNSLHVTTHADMISKLTRVQKELSDKISKVDGQLLKFEQQLDGTKAKIQEKYEGFGDSGADKTKEEFEHLEKLSNEASRKHRIQQKEFKIRLSICNHMISILALSEKVVPSQQIPFRMHKYKRMTYHICRWNIEKVEEIKLNLDSNRDGKLRIVSEFDINYLEKMNAASISFAFLVAALAYLIYYGLSGQLESSHMEKFVLTKNLNETTAEAQSLSTQLLMERGVNEKLTLRVTNLEAELDEWKAKYAENERLLKAERESSSLKSGRLEESMRFIDALNAQSNECHKSLQIKVFDLKECENEKNKKGTKSSSSSSTHPMKIATTILALILGTVLIL